MMGFLSSGNNGAVSDGGGSGGQRQRWVGKPALPAVSVAVNAGLSSFRDKMTTKMEGGYEGHGKYLIIDDSDRTESTCTVVTFVSEAPTACRSLALSQQQHEHHDDTVSCRSVRRTSCPVTPPSRHHGRSSPPTTTTAPARLSRPSSHGSLSSAASSSRTPGAVHRRVTDPPGHHKHLSRSRPRRATAPTASGRRTESSSQSKSRGPRRSSLQNQQAARSVLVDSQGCCSRHPYVQLRRLSGRTKEWKTLLDSCPLCDAGAGEDDADCHTIVARGERSDACKKEPTSHECHLRPRRQSQPAKGRSRPHSHSLPVNSKEEQKPKHLQRSRSHSRSTRRSGSSSSRSKSRRPSQRARSHSQARKRSSISVPSPTKGLERSISLYCPPQKIDELRKEGYHSLKFDCSSVTLPASNLRSSAASALNVKKNVRFIDGANSSKGATDIAVSTSSLVTKVHSRPYTTKVQKERLYYSNADVRRFRKSAMLDVLAERAASQGPSRDHVEAEVKVENIIRADTPLLNRILFDDDHRVDAATDDSERESIVGDGNASVSSLLAALPDEVQSRMMLLTGTAVQAGMADPSSAYRTLTVQSRKWRGVRKFLHREAVVIHF